MSWHFSRELVEEYLAVSSLDGKPSAQWRLMPIAQAYLSSDRMTVFSRLSRFGMTFEPLTESLGRELLTWYLAGFPAKHTQPQLRESQLQMISGRKCGESWQMSLPGTYLPRTYQEKPLKQSPKTLRLWATKPKRLPLVRQTWVAITYGEDFGYVHTPTAKANFAAKSMQKWESCRNFVGAFGRPSPENFEYLMGWVPGWTELKPLGMDKFLQWRQKHGEC